METTAIYIQVLTLGIIQNWQ